MYRNDWPMDKIKLDPASALFMEWGVKNLDSDILQSFTDHLDFSSAKEIRNEFNSICSWYDEVVLNCEYIIDNYIEEELNKSDEKHLILILSAGNSPLALEILKRFEHKVNQILEIDSSGMDEKKELYGVFYPQYAEIIKCITADIKSKPVLELLNNLLHEYYNDSPCIIIMEGVSFYLDKCELEKIIASFKSRNGSNTFIFEYLLPDEKVTDERRTIPVQVFDKIKQYKGIDRVTTLSNENVNDIMQKIGGRLVKHDSLMNMEKLRTGQNKYFQKPEDGWIESAVWQL